MDPSTIYWRVLSHRKRAFLYLRSIHRSASEPRDHYLRGELRLSANAA
jgi:hypothetical protein